MSTTDRLRVCAREDGFALYEIEPTADPTFSRYIASTPETRAICNDPLVLGVDYTDLLGEACSKILSVFQNHCPLTLRERELTVLHILRGGLNFGLREAAARALGMNSHAAAFLSSQRVRQSQHSDEWMITESGYKKITLPKRASILFGDVVATGTSLEHGLTRLLDEVSARGSELLSMVFFTIGGPRSEEILLNIHRKCKESFPSYQGTAVIYLEGRFQVESIDDEHIPRFAGTDLLRTGSLIAPEFLQSQYDEASYPVERCTIYDAGSRAFWVPEYLEDVKAYWEQVLKLAEEGLTYRDYLMMRMPELFPDRFGDVDLRVLALQQLSRIDEVMSDAQPEKYGEGEAPRH